VRQVLVESVLLAAVGGLLGVGVGAVLLRTLVAHLPADLPRLGGVLLDWAVLAFSATVSLTAGLLFGLVPALQVSGASPMGALRDGTRISGVGGAVRSGLVVSEVALALMLLAGAGLLGRSFAALVHVPAGFAAERLLTFTATLPTAVYATPAERSGFFERAAEAIDRLPGVRTVTFATTLPVAGRGNGAWFNMLDRPVPSDQTPPAVPNRFVRANYFDAMGIPVVRGRGFTAHDGERAANVVVISASVAKRFFADRDPIGRRIYMGAPDNRVVPESEIVGVVADVKQRGLDEAHPEAVYVPHAMERRMPSFTFAVRTSADPAALAAAVRDVLRRLDPRVPVLRLQTMDDILARSTAPARSSMLLVSLFATVALALALIGVFGVLSYTVAQRRAEFGIRMALGASAAAVRLQVLGAAMRTVMVGVLVGLTGALALSRYLEALLFGVRPSDPVTLCAVVTLLVLTAVAAASIPARRATRVDPMEVLRQQ
jgi:putative ABC transport system permease protein